MLDCNSCVWRVLCPCLSELKFLACLVFISCRFREDITTQTLCLHFLLCSPSTEQCRPKHKEHGREDATRPCGALRQAGAHWRVQEGGAPGGCQVGERVIVELAKLCICILNYDTFSFFNTLMLKHSLHTHTHTFRHAHTNTHTCTPAYTHTYTPAYTHTYTPAYTHTPTCTPTYTHTYTHRSGRLVGGEWAVDGCHRNDNLSNTTVTVCECNHLTHFAILLSPGPVVSSCHTLVMM